MNMKNNIESNVDYVVDVELLHIESLIEEREIYEEEFLSIAPPIDEINYLIYEYENHELEFIFDDSVDPSTMMTIRISCVMKY